MVKAFLNNAIGSTFKGNQHSYWKQCFLLKNTLQSEVKNQSNSFQHEKEVWSHFHKPKGVAWTPANIENGEFASIVNH